MAGRIIIAGCGDIGSALGVALIKDGHQVWGLRRNTEALPEALSPLRVDLGEPIAPGTLPGNISAVVYTVAPNERTDAAYHRAYVKGVSHLLGALTPTARVLFVSSTSVYGQTTGEWVDEASPTTPPGFNGRQILEAERLVHSSASQSTCIRFGGIYGPARARLAKQVLAGDGTLKTDSAPGVPFFTNRIHRDDCVSVLHFLLTLPATPEILLGVDTDPAPYNEVLQWIATRAGKSLQGPKSSPSLGPNKRCSNRVLQSLGFQLRYPSFRDGYGEILTSLLGTLDK